MSMVARSGGGARVIPASGKRAAIALAMAWRPSPEIAWSSQPHPQNERRRSRSVTSMKPIVPAVNNGYLYDLFRKIGLSDFGARTGSFILEQPVRIGVTLLAAWLATRFAVRAIRRFASSVHRRAPSRM